MLSMSRTAADSSEDRAWTEAESRARTRDIDIGWEIRTAAAFVPGAEPQDAVRCDTYVLSTKAKGSALQSLYFWQSEMTSSSAMAGAVGWSTASNDVRRCNGSRPARGSCIRLHQ